MTAQMPAPITLEGDTVRLEPLTDGHIPDLFAAGGHDDEVWRWVTDPTPRTEAELARIAARLVEAADHVPFTVILKESGRAVGWTTYIDTPGYADSIEIGWTWYGRACGAPG